jgi:hypothetical protein
VASRLKQIAEACCQSADIAVDSVMQRIHVYRITSLVHLMALWHVLEKRIQEDPSIRLIVLDSVAFHFRNSTDMVHKLKLRHIVREHCMEWHRLFGSWLAITKSLLY